MFWTQEKRDDLVPFALVVELVEMTQRHAVEMFKAMMPDSTMALPPNLTAEQAERLDKIMEGQTEDALARLYGDARNDDVVRWKEKMMGGESVEDDT